MQTYLVFWGEFLIGAMFGFSLRGVLSDWTQRRRYRRQERIQALHNSIAEAIEKAGHTIVVSFDLYWTSGPADTAEKALRRVVQEAPGFQALKDVQNQMVDSALSIARADAFNLAALAAAHHEIDALVAKLTDRYLREAAEEILFNLNMHVYASRTAVRGAGLDPNEIETEFASSTT